MNKQNINAGQIEQTIMYYSRCKYLATSHPIARDDDATIMEAIVNNLIQHGHIVVSVAHTTGTENVLFMENNRVRAVSRRRENPKYRVSSTAIMCGARSSRDARLYAGPKSWYVVDKEALLNQVVPDLEDDLCKLNAKVDNIARTVIGTPNHMHSSWKNKILELIALGDAEQNRQNKIWSDARVVLNTLLS